MAAHWVIMAGDRLAVDRVFATKIQAERFASTQPYNDPQAPRFLWSHIKRLTMTKVRR